MTTANCKLQTEKFRNSFSLLVLCLQPTVHSEPKKLGKMHRPITIITILIPPTEHAILEFQWTTSGHHSQVLLNAPLEEQWSHERMGGTKKLSIFIVEWENGRRIACKYGANRVGNVHDLCTTVSLEWIK